MYLVVTKVTKNSCILETEGVWTWAEVRKRWRGNSLRQGLTKYSSWLLPLSHTITPLSLTDFCPCRILLPLHLLMTSAHIHTPSVSNIQLFFVTSVTTTYIHTIYISNFPFHLSCFILSRFHVPQANPDSPQGDPDTPPQKYFTIMVERIPGHLRSAAALYKFFEKLFPGKFLSVSLYYFI